MQKARRHPSEDELRLLVSTRFQVLLTPLAGVLFTFPSRYWFTIGRWRVFSLGGWSPRIPTGFLVSRGTWERIGSHFVFAYRAFTFSGCLFLKHSANEMICNSHMTRPATPARFESGRFRLVPVRSPLLRESLLLSLPQGTEMVHFPWLPSFPLLHSGEDT